MYHCVILFESFKVQRQFKESGKVIFARVYVHFLNECLFLRRVVESESCGSFKHVTALSLLYSKKICILLLKLVSILCATFWFYAKSSKYSPKPIVAGSKKPLKVELCWRTPTRQCAPKIIKLYIWIYKDFCFTKQNVEFRG